MRDKFENLKEKFKTVAYMLPCLALAGGAVLAGGNRAEATSSMKPEAYDIAKVEQVLETIILQNENTKTVPETTIKKSVSKTVKKTSAKKTKAHGEAQSFLDGTYEGVGVGFAGHIKVKVVVEDSKIVSIEVVEVEGDDGPFVAKAKGVIDAMLEYQTIDVDTVSGATYSSKGIIAAVRNALEGVEDDSQTAAPAAKPAPTAIPKFQDSSYKDGTYYGTGTGFGGEVKVKVVISDGKITEITVENASGEDGSYLARAKTLIPNMIEKQSPNVDTVSGATYTSNGIISAVQDALSQAKSQGEQQEQIVLQGQGGKQQEGKYQDGTYEGSANGFRGITKATVVIQKSVMTELTIESEDDEAFLNKALALKDTILEKQTVEGIDVVTGATYSSKGILGAVKEALAKAAMEDTPRNRQEPDQEEKLQPTKVPAPTNTITPKPQDGGEEKEEKEEVKPYKDGTFEGIGEGFNGKITVSVTVSDGVITKITTKKYVDDDDFFWNAFDGISAQIKKKQSAVDIDTVSGATFSSKGIIAAIQQALEQAKN